MIQYVSLTEAKTHLRVDTDADDDHILLLIYAASGAVKNYLKDASVYEPERGEDEDPEIDSSYEPVVVFDSSASVRYEVRVACLILIGEWYRNREADQKYELGHGYLPAPVVAILYPLRDPACQ